MNPLNIDSKVEELVKIDCGTLFNIKDYLNERITITNTDKSVEYKLSDFDYTVDCPETVYNADANLTLQNQESMMLSLP